MSDNNEPLDLAAIEARLAAISLDAEWLEVVKSKPRHLLVYTDEDEVFELPKDFIANAPTDIAALVSEVKRLREDYTKHTANLNRIIDSNHREIWQLQKELAEAKRTQVKDGGRVQLRPFPEPDGEE